MKTLFSAELWRKGSINNRYITPGGLIKDIPCLDQNYLWNSREEAQQAVGEELKTWSDSDQVQISIQSHEVLE
jgi:hypothetical protein